MEKKFYWIKLKTDFFDLPTIDFLLSQKNGCEYIVLYQMLCLMTANNDGELSSRFGEMIVPFDVEKIVRDTKYFDFDTVVVAFDLFKKLGLIYESENDVLKISNYQEMIGSESKWASKKREYRHKKALIENEGQLIGHGEDNVRQEIDKDKEKEIEKEIDKEKEKTKKETYVSIIDAYTSNDDLKSALKDYVEMRKKMKGFTVRALDLALNKLDEIALDDYTKIDVVNQSVMNGWKSFYPLHAKTNERKENRAF